MEGGAARWGLTVNSLRELTKNSIDSTKLTKLIRTPLETGTHLRCGQHVDLTRADLELTGTLWEYSGAHRNQLSADLGLSEN